MRYVITSKHWSGEAQVFDTLAEVEQYVIDRKDDFQDSIEELQELRVFEIGKPLAIKIVPVTVSIEIPAEENKSIPAPLANETIGEYARRLTGL